MTETVHMLEAVGLHVERTDGWLARVLDAIDGRRFRLDSLVLHGPIGGAGLMRLTLMVRARASTPEALLTTLQTVPGVRFVRLQSPWQKGQKRKMLSSSGPAAQSHLPGGNEPAVASFVAAP